MQTENGVPILVLSSRYSHDSRLLHSVACQRGWHMSRLGSRNVPEQLVQHRLIFFGEYNFVQERADKRSWILLDVRQSRGVSLSVPTQKCSPQACGSTLQPLFPPLPQGLILTHIFLERPEKRVSADGFYKTPLIASRIQGCFTEAICKMWVKDRPQGEGYPKWRHHGKPTRN